MNSMFTAMLAAAARKTPEPSPVRNGLIFWLDALNNTGHGLDTTAASWVDLIGGNNLPLDLSRVAWQDGMCLLTAAGNYGSAITPNAIFTENGSYTFEAVVKFPTVDPAWIAQIREGSTDYCHAYVSNGNKIGCRCGTSSTAGVATVNPACLVVSVDYATGAMATYINGVNKSSGTATSPSRPLNVGFQAFAQTTGGAYSAVGSGIFAVHVYDRVLMADEVAANYDYAVARYGI